MLLEFDHAVLVLVAFFGSRLELGAQGVAARAAVVRGSRDRALDLIFTGEKCKAEMEKLAAELEKVAAEKDAAVAHQKELQDALDVANKQLKKEAIVIASKDEFIKTLIQTPAAA